MAEKFVNYPINEEKQFEEPQPWKDCLGLAWVFLDGDIVETKDDATKSLVSCA